MKIISIEEKAQEVIKDAKKADKELESRINDESHQMEKDIKKKMTAKNMMLQEREAQEADKKIEAINVNTNRHLAELEKKCSDHKDAWVNEIVKNIIGR